MADVDLAILVSASRLDYGAAMNLRTALYPALAPYRHGHLAVDALHTLYWEESGNPQGVPVLFLHGGPGTGTHPSQRQYFDPTYYRIVLFDQRGAGRSTPLGETRHNTTQHLIADIEQLRQHLGIDQWLLFGGSWGSTLALAYAQAHPAPCLGLILRGIFLCTQAEIDWFLYGMRHFYPRAWADFVAPIPHAQRHDLLTAYEQRLANPLTAVAAAQAWGRYEGACLFLIPQEEAAAAFGSEAIAIGLAQLEAHYFRHQGFFSDDQLIENLPAIRHLPAILIQGRYDIICPPLTADRLAHAWPEAHYQLIDAAGHGGFDPAICKALVAATEQFKLHGQF